MNQLKRFSLILIGSLAPMLSAFAHHSVSAWFDTHETSELEGEVTEMHWQNPHVRFILNVRDASGATAAWDIETLSLAGISRWGITEDLIKVGDHLKVAGNPSKRSRNNLFVRNILLPTGEEIVLGGQPRWSGETLRAGEIQSEASGDSSAPELGLFRTWVSAAGGTFLFPEELNPDFDFGVYPLTAAARAALEAFAQAHPEGELVFHEANQGQRLYAIQHASALAAAEPKRALLVTGRLIVPALTANMGLPPWRMVGILD